MMIYAPSAPTKHQRLVFYLVAFSAYIIWFAAGKFARTAHITASMEENCAIPPPSSTRQTIVFQPTIPYILECAAQLYTYAVYVFNIQHIDLLGASYT